MNMFIEYEAQLIFCPRFMLIYAYPARYHMKIHRYLYVIHAQMPATHFTKSL